MKKEFSEYIFLDNNGNIMYTSRNIPMKYEEQTDCIVVHCDNEYDLDRLLDILIPLESLSVNKACGSATIEEVIELDPEYFDKKDDLPF